MTELFSLHPIIPSTKADLQLYDQAILLVDYNLTSLIRDVIQAPDDFSLHFSIRYTDDGMFLKRQESILSALFFTKPLRNPEEDKAILALYSEKGLIPKDNYFADFGRTRILSYPISDNSQELTELVADVFIQAYQIGRVDQLTIDQK